MAIKVKYKNKIFESVKEFCNYVNEDPKHIHRLYHKYEIEFIPLFISDNGKKYYTYRQIALDFNISVARIKNYLTSGFSFDEILKLIRGTKGSGIYTEDFVGNRFCSIAELCRYWNISRTAYDHRFENGYSQTECIIGVRTLDKLIFLEQNKEKIPKPLYNELKETFTKQRKKVTHRNERSRSC